jgi:4-hydroxybutyrate dehydrogenase
MGHSQCKTVQSQGFSAEVRKLESSAFSYPTRVELACGGIRRLPSLIQEFGSKALIVTDPGLVDLPVFEQVLKPLKNADVPFEVFSSISPNPVATECEDGAQVYRRTGADVIVGVGGGSALDGAKGIALMATHPEPIVEYDDAKGGYERIEDRLPPMICVPTTAGTGSEVGRSTVVVNPETNKKVVVFSPYLMPDVALVDPELHTTMPSWLTAATGFDALTHNLEAYTATGYHPLCDGLALEGLSLCHTHLKSVFADPGNLEARRGMAMAALMGATAFQKGLGAAHSLAHPLSTISGLHHGLANAIVLPYVVAFNAEAAEPAYRIVARRLGLETDLWDWIVELRQWLNIPHTLKEAGVDSGDLDALTGQAIEDSCHLTNPRACTRSCMAELYQAAFEGRRPNL